MEPFLSPSDPMGFTKTELSICDYIYQNLTSVPLLSIDELASRLQVSTATISRFAKHCGCTDYKMLRMRIAQHAWPSAPAAKMQQTLASDRVASGTAFLKYQADCIEKTIELFSEEEFGRAADIIAGAPNIFLYGKGAAVCLCDLLQFRLLRFGKNVVKLPVGSSDLFERLVHVKPEDLVIIFGLQKISVEGSVLLSHARKVGYHTLLFSADRHITPGQGGDVDLCVYRGDEGEYHSMASSMALVDALIVATAQRMEDRSLQILSSLYRLKETYKEEIPR